MYYVTKFVLKEPPLAGLSWDLRWHFAFRHDPGRVRLISLLPVQNPDGIGWYACP